MCFCLVLSVLVAGDKDVSRSGIYTTSNEYNVPVGVTGISGLQILLLFLFCFCFCHRLLIYIDRNVRSIQIIMWFEILPAFSIVVIALALPPFISVPINYLCTGHMYRRSMQTMEERMLYIRDTAITGSAYVMNYCIPDAEEPREGKQEDKNGGEEEN